MSIVLLGLMAATIVSLVLRYRRAQRDQREQIRWLLLRGGGHARVVLPPPSTMGSAGGSTSSRPWCRSLIPISIGIAILKYRLYDVDVVINKTVVFAVLAAFVTIVYVALVSSGSARCSVPAAALCCRSPRQGSRSRSSRCAAGGSASRIGSSTAGARRRTRSSRVLRPTVGAYADEDLLPRMARILAEGTGAARADVWLRVGVDLVPRRAFPADASPRGDVDVGAMPAEARPVTHQGELLGALVDEMPPATPSRRPRTS